MKTISSLPNDLQHIVYGFMDYKTPHWNMLRSLVGEWCFTCFQQSTLNQADNYCSHCLRTICSVCQVQRCDGCMNNLCDDCNVRVGLTNCVGCARDLCGWCFIRDDLCDDCYGYDE